MLSIYSRRSGVQLKSSVPKAGMCSMNESTMWDVHQDLLCSMADSADHWFHDVPGASIVRVASLHLQHLGARRSSVLGNG
jgi:hypothetical protein